MNNSSDIPLKPYNDTSRSTSSITKARARTTTKNTSNSFRLEATTAIYNKNMEGLMSDKMVGWEELESRRDKRRSFRVFYRCSFFLFFKNTNQLDFLSTQNRDIYRSRYLCDKLRRF